MTPGGNDRWQGTFHVIAVGRHEYTVIAWVDRFLTWRHDFARRQEAADALQAALRLVPADSETARRVRDILKAYGEK